MLMKSILEDLNLSVTVFEETIRIHLEKIIIFENQLQTIHPIA